jgi:hypothetical protein
MTIEELIHEGESLQKPSFLLSETETDSGVVAYWGGSRADVPEQMPPEVTAFRTRHHLLTISEHLFRQIVPDLSGRFGAVGLFEARDAQGRHFRYGVECDSRKPFESLSFTGSPLFATPAQSFPPFQAVCLHGGERVGAWLKSIGMRRHDYWKVACGVAGVESKALAEAYEKEDTRRSPLSSPDSVDVIVGGWHTMWPDDDYYAPPELQLLFLTLRDAEPWFEGWHCPMSQSFFHKERIT